MRRIALFLLLSLPTGLWAQPRTVGGEFTYYADPTMSPKEALAAAIEHAKIQAIAKEFGTMVSQTTLMEESKRNLQEDSRFMQLSTLEVKGEWMEDLEKPTSQIVGYEPDGMLIIKAKVRGRARPLKNDAMDFDVHVLRNGTDIRFENTEFLDGDSLFLLFQSPVDAFVAVYLVDENQTVSCLLPYQNDEKGEYAVKRDQTYYFFSSRLAAKGENPLLVDEMVMLCPDNAMELNRLYVVCSPNRFAKAQDRLVDALLPRQLGYKDLRQFGIRMLPKNLVI